MLSGSDGTLLIGSPLSAPLLGSIGSRGNVDGVGMLGGVGAAMDGAQATITINSSATGRIARTPGMRVRTPFKGSPSLGECIWDVAQVAWNVGAASQPS
ncbi:MAG: hypothetical protein Kow0047_22480 [Anaerolineae bacterium]